MYCFWCNFQAGPQSAPVFESREELVAHYKTHEERGEYGRCVNEDCKYAKIFFDV